MKLCEKDDQFYIKLMMPDNSGNFLHGDEFSKLDLATQYFDSLIGCEIPDGNIAITEVEKYFILNLNIQGKDGGFYYFHSRKLNLIDVIDERMQLMNSVKTEK